MKFTVMVTGGLGYITGQQRTKFTLKDLNSYRQLNIAVIFIVPLAFKCSCNQHALESHVNCSSSAFSCITYVLFAWENVIKNVCKFIRDCVKVKLIHSQTKQI